MALISCPNCGKQISDRATTCPGCGYNPQIKASEQVDHYNFLLNNIPPKNKHHFKKKHLIISAFLVFIVLVSVFCLHLATKGFFGCFGEHTYDNGKITTKATCSTEGIKTFTCTKCSATKEESTAKLSHRYLSKITKEATFSEKGTETFTCSLCGNSYNQDIPVRDDEVVVSVTNKINIPEDLNAGRYSDRVEFTFTVQNMTSRAIKGVQGTLIIRDSFDNIILRIGCDFTGNTIPAHESISNWDMGIDINQFMDNHVKLYSENYDSLKFSYETNKVIFTDTDFAQNIYSDTSLNSQKITVTVTDKKNLAENWNANRYSPRVNFSFNVQNNTSKDVKGVQGTLMIKDMFGDTIMSLNCDFTGQTIKSRSSAQFSNLGFDVNEFIDEQTKVYRELYDDLIFEYTVTGIVYSDGTEE